ncbi:uncharacterized protein LOC106427587 [Brassica napus]|uniref:uncharacterized protein LOC106427587 n=1 Tax=Brassica napus TaxID=3708 RepID=UPI002078E1D6|nr:uncharacterized protein LOC106427587 [Brassica napus]
MEKNFEAMECLEEYKKKIDVYYLQGDATGWESFKGEFERKYFPPEPKHRLERQFMNFVQGDMPVRSYESEFTRLRRHVFDGHEDEATMIRNFMYGLKPELGSHLAGSNFSSLSEIVEKAVNVETVLEAERKTIPHSGGHTNFSQGERLNFNKGQKSNKGKGRGFGGQANNRGNTGGHYASSCQNKPIPSTPLAIQAPPSRPAIEPAPKSQNLRVVSLKGYEVILGMDWLSSYGVQIDCGKGRFLFGRAMRVQDLFQDGEVYLVTLSVSGGAINDEVKVEDIEVVQEFEDIFAPLKELPPPRSNPFTITLEPEAKPIAKAPYRMTPVELAELKKQLEDLLENGFIRSSSSPWGAPVLFVKKKDGNTRFRG